MTVTKWLNALTSPSQNSLSIKKRSGGKSCEKDFGLGICILFHGQEFMWSVCAGLEQFRKSFWKVTDVKKKKISVLCVTVNPDLKTH